MTYFDVQPTVRGRSLPAASFCRTVLPPRRAEGTSQFHAYGAEEGGASPTAAASFDGVDLRTGKASRRLTAAWRGLRAEIVNLSERQRYESEYCGPYHLLIAYEEVVTLQGESTLDGVQRSTLRDLRRKLTFVPAGRRFHEWQEPRTPGRMICLYIEVGGPLIGPDGSGVAAELAPRLLFDSPALCQTVRKLAALIEAGPPGRPDYAEALGVVLTHELLWLDRARKPDARPARGGLAGWQLRAILGHLEEQLAEQVSIAKLAELTHLSPFHLSRAFKQSVGMPPHRFHLSLRIERAKILLAEPTLSMTDIALALGFSGSSSFTVTFRKFTGRTPTDYRRSLV